MPYATNPEDGRRTYFEDDGGAGPSVLFFSGYSDSIADSRENVLARGLAGHCRLVFADHRGHGKSDKPHTVDAYGLRRRVGDVVSVLDTLDIDRVGFAGSSWGARLGFAVGEYAPERLSCLILGGNQPYAWDLESSLIKAAVTAASVLESEGMTGFLKVAESALGERFPEPGRSRIQQNDPKALKAAWESIYGEGCISNDLSRWTTPCLIYAGANDSMHDDARRAASEIPNARFITIPDATHMSAVGAEEVVLEEALQLVLTTGTV